MIHTTALNLKTHLSDLNYIILSDPANKLFNDDQVCVNMAFPIFALNSLNMAEN